MKLGIRMTQKQYDKINEYATGYVECICGYRFESNEARALISQPLSAVAESKGGIFEIIALCKYCYPFFVKLIKDRKKLKSRA